MSTKSQDPNRVACHGPIRFTRMISIGQQTKGDKVTPDSAVQRGNYLLIDWPCAINHNQRVH